MLFDPSIFVSDFNHIFVIVEKVSNDSLQDLYEVRMKPYFKTKNETHMSTNQFNSLYLFIK